MAPDLSVLLPCCNEAAGVPRLEAELFPSLDRLGTAYEVVAVDDGSSDGTGAALRALAGLRPELRVLSHERNLGLGAALKTALASARGEWAVALDADLTFHPDRIADLRAAQKATGADCVSGSPFLAPSPEVPLARRLPSALLNAFYRGIFSRALTSYTPLFRLYRVADLRGLVLRSSGFEISVEILARLLRSGRRVVEVPVPLGARRSGESKLRRWRELKGHARLAVRLLTGF